MDEWAIKDAKKLLDETEYAGPKCHRPGRRGYVDYMSDVGSPLGLVYESWLSGDNSGLLHVIRRGGL